MSRRLKLGTKLEIENMCVVFWCLTVVKNYWRIFWGNKRSGVRCQVEVMCGGQE
jgi:hypothetical protein